MRQCTIMQNPTSTSHALPGGKACVYLGLDVAGGTGTQTWRLRAPLCSASHPIVAAFHSLPAIHQTSQVDGAANADAPTLIEAGDDTTVQEQISALQEDLPLSVDDLLPPMNLAAFSDITSSQTHDTVLRHNGPQLYKAALQHNAAWGSPIGQSEMSGRVR